MYYAGTSEEKHCVSLAQACRPLLTVEEHGKEMQGSEINMPVGDQGEFPLLAESIGQD